MTVFRSGLVSKYNFPPDTLGRSIDGQHGVYSCAPLLGHSRAVELHLNSRTRLRGNRQGQLLDNGSPAALQMQHAEQTNFCTEL
jgi:hypothetical protein